MLLQLSGSKKALLLPPSAAATARLFPSLHPGYRQTQLQPTMVLNGSAKESPAPTDAAVKLGKQALVVELYPGDVLVLPPYWMHRMEVTGTPAADKGGNSAVPPIGCATPSVVVAKCNYCVTRLFVVAGMVSQRRCRGG
eukprot:SAG31_NODE_3650_length_4028_cov_1.617205_6_plen_139_part_00